MIVAENKEELREFIAEVVRETTRTLVTVQTHPHVATSGDPEAILSYEDAAALVGRKPETIRAWTVRRKGGPAPRLRRYKCGRAAGVKRGELLAAWQAEGGAANSEVGADEQAEAIFSGKKKGKK